MHKDVEELEQEFWDQYMNFYKDQKTQVPYKFTKKSLKREIIEFMKERFWQLVLAENQNNIKLLIDELTEPTINNEDILKENIDVRKLKKRQLLELGFSPYLAYLIKYNRNPRRLTINKMKDLLSESKNNLTKFKKLLQIRKSKDANTQTIIDESEQIFKNENIFDNILVLKKNFVELIEDKKVQLAQKYFKNNNKQSSNTTSIVISDETLQEETAEEDEEKSPKGNDKKKIEEEEATDDDEEKNPKGKDKKKKEEETTEDDGDEKRKFGFDDSKINHMLYSHYAYLKVIQTKIVSKKKQSPFCLSMNLTVLMTKPIIFLLTFQLALIILIIIKNRVQDTQPNSISTRLFPDIPGWYHAKLKIKVLWVAQIVIFLVNFCFSSYIIPDYKKMMKTKNKMVQITIARISSVNGWLITIAVLSIISSVYVIPSEISNLINENADWKKWMKESQRTYFLKGNFDDKFKNEKINVGIESWSYIALDEIHQYFKCCGFEGPGYFKSLDISKNVTKNVKLMEPFVRELTNFIKKGMFPESCCKMENFNTCDVTSLEETNDFFKNGCSTIIDSYIMNEWLGEQYNISICFSFSSIGILILNIFWIKPKECKRKMMHMLKRNKIYRLIRKLKKRTHTQKRKV